MLDASEVRVFGSGHVYVAPYGSTMPEAFDDTIDSAFQDLGYLTEDGFRMTPNLTSQDTYGWQSSSPLRTDTTRFEIVIAIDMLQSNEDVTQLYFGGGTFDGTVYSAPDVADGVDFRALVADVTDGDSNLRFWFPKVAIATNREVTFTRSAASQWGVDLKVLQVADVPLFQFDDAGDSEFPAYPYP